jgi:hypothetical protein
MMLVEGDEFSFSMGSTSGGTTSMGASLGGCGESGGPILKVE